MLRARTHGGPSCDSSCAPSCAPSAFAIGAGADEGDLHTARAQAVIPRELAGMALGSLGRQIEQAAAALAVEMIVGLEIAVVAHPARRRGHLEHEPLRHEHLEIAIDGREGERGDPISQRVVELGGRRVRAGRTQTGEQLVALTGMMPTRCVSGRVGGVHEFDSRIRAGAGSRDFEKNSRFLERGLQQPASIRSRPRPIVRGSWTLPRRTSIRAPPGVDPAWRARGQAGNGRPPRVAAAAWR